MERNTFESCFLPLLSEDSVPVINWLKQQRLLKSKMKCENCSQSMNWTKYSRGTDGYIWKCQYRNCPKYKCTLSIRNGSFFAKSRITLQKWVHAMFLWCERIGETQAINILNISERTVINIYNFFREVCKVHFQVNPILLGGPGVIVQIDESCFSHKLKYHKGRGSQSPVWVFGAVDTSTSLGQGYMTIVNKRDTATLLPIIQTIVRPGSIIYSDEWKAYTNIQRDLGLQHQTFNHSLQFLDPNTGIHTQAIESYWGKHKHQIKKMCGCKREFLNSYLQEFMWMDRYSANGFMHLVHHIAIQFPC